VARESLPASTCGCALDAGPCGPAAQCCMRMPLALSTRTPPVPPPHATTDTQRPALRCTARPSPHSTRMPRDVYTVRHAHSPAHLPCSEGLGYASPTADSTRRDGETLTLSCARPTRLRCGGRKCLGRDRLRGAGGVTGDGRTRGRVRRTRAGDARRTWWACSLIYESHTFINANDAPRPCLDGRDALL
jgi:hypothetical protein